MGLSDEAYTVNARAPADYFRLLLVPLRHLQRLDGEIGTARADYFRLLLVPLRPLLFVFRLGFFLVLLLLFASAASGCPPSTASALAPTSARRPRPRLVSTVRRVIGSGAGRSDRTSMRASGHSQADHDLVKDRAQAWHEL